MISFAKRRLLSTLFSTTTVLKFSTVYVINTVKCSAYILPDIKNGLSVSTQTIFELTATLTSCSSKIFFLIILRNTFCTFTTNIPLPAWRIVRTFTTFSIVLKMAVTAWTLKWFFCLSFVFTWIECLFFRTSLLKPSKWPL